MDKVQQAPNTRGCITFSDQVDTRQQIKKRGMQVGSNTETTHLLAEDNFET